MTKISLKNISKTYNKGTVKALKNINLEVNSGELFGLLGPDGAGKTTLFRILTTLLLPDTGTAFMGQLNVIDNFWEIRKRVGYMPGKFSLYQDLTIKENLDFFAQVFGTTLDQNYDLIKDIYVQLEPFKNRPAGKLSGGMKQKLALCCALIHQPKVLYLDEPTTGVDPVSRNEFWDMLERLKSKGITQLVSTPYMDEASRCDRIALMQEGEILELNSLENILDKHKTNMLAIKGENMYQLLLDTRDFAMTKSCFGFGEYHHVLFKSENQDPKELLTFLRTKGHTKVEFKPISPDIEDVFIKLMQS